MNNCRLYSHHPFLYTMDLDLLLIHCIDCLEMCHCKFKHFTVINNQQQCSKCSEYYFFYNAMCYLLKFIKFHGSSQVWNHAAALLFKLEYVTRLEISNPVCTTAPCQWDEPSTSSTFPASITLRNMKSIKPPFNKYSDLIFVDCRSNSEHSIVLWKQCHFAGRSPEWCVSWLA